MAYMIGIGLIGLLFICTVPYKKTLRKKLDKKEHRLKMLYGISMFLTDKLPKKIIYRNTTTNKLIRELTVKEDIKREKYLYVVEKMAVSILVLIMCLMFGLIVNISEGKNTEIKYLQRDSNEIKVYKFVAEDDAGKKEDIKIDLNEKELKEEQIFKLFDSKKDELLQAVLKDNSSLDKVDTQLDLISRLGDENISVAWSISNSGVIGYDGIISENVSKNGENVNLTATMILNNVSKEYTFSAKVFPAKDTQSLQNQIQSYVNENEAYEDDVQLPSEINGKQLHYFYEPDKISIIILPIGVVLAVAIFFLKDRDLKKETEKRDQQMMRDYPQIVSKTLLYYNAGLSILSTFERIVKEYKAKKEENEKTFRYAYEELELMLIKMKSGISESAALSEFGVRCGLHCYIKFAGILEQNLRRGSRELSYALKTEVNSAVLEKKNATLKMGNYISTKLLGPMIVMLVVSMAIIMVPALLSINL